MIPAPTSQDPRRELRAAALLNQRRLFGRRETAPLQLCFWAESRACYGWRLTADGVVLRMLDHHERLDHLPRKSKILVELSHAGPEVAEKALSARALAANARPLHAKKGQEAPAMRSSLLIEIGDDGHRHLLDPYALEHYEPQPYRSALLDLVFGIESRFFPELNAYLQAISSPVAALPAQPLAAELAKEADATLAYIYRALPAKNVRNAVHSLPADRRAQVLQRAAALPLTAIQDHSLLQKVEKSLLMAIPRAASTGEP